MHQPPSASQPPDEPLPRKSKAETPAASDGLVREIDQHQYTLGEGPCLTAATGHVPVVRVADLHADQWWPKFSDEHNRPALIGDDVTLLPVIDLLGTPHSPAEPRLDGGAGRGAELHAVGFDVHQLDQVLHRLAYAHSVSEIGCYGLQRRGSLRDQPGGDGCSRPRR